MKVVTYDTYKPSQPSHEILKLIRPPPVAHNNKSLAIQGLLQHIT
jgi:hypothetical protein